MICAAALGRLITPVVFKGFVYGRLDLWLKLPALAAGDSVVLEVLEFWYSCWTFLICSCAESSCFGLVEPALTVLVARTASGFGAEKTLAEAGLLRPGPGNRIGCCFKSDRKHNSYKRHKLKWTEHTVEIA